LLLLIVVPAAAVNTITMNVAVTSDKQYMTADGKDYSTISILVTDNTGLPVKKAGIEIAVPSPWGLFVTSGWTGGNGYFSPSFNPTTVSGNAVLTITVNATGVANSPVVVNYTQVIVGADPQKAISLHPSSAVVGSLAKISVLVTDANGNPVSSRKQMNVVLFNTSMTGDNGFLDTTSNSTVKGIAVPLDDSGHANVNYSVGTTEGTNYITVTPPFPLPQSLISIKGIPAATPASITQTVTPEGNPPTLVTGSTAYFVINYRLLDAWGNPSAYQNLTISVNTGEQMTVMSNSGGNVTVSYGPKKNAGVYTIYAQADGNISVMAAQTLQFVSGIPTNMILTASPQSMASLDVKDSSALVMAKVIDSQGNPVPGQTVTFSIQDVNTGTYVTTPSGPSLQVGDAKTSDTTGVSAVTDSSGYVIGTFTPGAFTTNTADPGYSLMASGVAQVRAKWSTISHDINLSYKNYPYLSILTSVNPPTVTTNSSVDISIVVRGDGYALKPKPVDAYLVTDRSLSMSITDAGSSVTRMTLVKGASSGFKDKFDSADRIGQFSFGGITTTFGDYATFDQPLTNQKGLIDSAISSLAPAGFTPLRYALYKAITDLARNGSGSSVKGLVVLSDGDYNYYGDPLARGSQGSTKPTSNAYYYDGTRYWYDFGGTAPKNMSEYARVNNIRIYTIGYSSSLTGSGQDTLRALANTTGGKYYYALTPDDLTSFYGQIAGALKDTAGVNTTLALDFPSVEVNGIANSTSSTLQYLYIDGISTKVKDPKGNVWTENSTADWNNGRINVTMGTIKVNQNWTVNLTLKTLANGNLKLLGSSSKVLFQDLNGVVGSAPLPDTYVTSIPEGIEMGLAPAKLTIYDLGVKIQDRTEAQLEWKIKYEHGNSPYIEEVISVDPLDSNPDLISPVGPPRRVDPGTTLGEYSLGIASLPKGSYRVRVTGSVMDASTASDKTIMTITETGEKPSILIR
jgi:hypothetical protein